MESFAVGRSRRLPNFRIRSHQVAIFWSQPFDAFVHTSFVEAMVTFSGECCNSTEFLFVEVNLTKILFWHLTFRSWNSSECRSPSSSLSRCEDLEIRYKMAHNQITNIAEAIEQKVFALNETEYKSFQTHVLHSYPTARSMLVTD